MIRFGCCGNMVAVKPDGIGIEILEQLNEIGYDYIELSLSHITALEEEKFLKLKSILDTSRTKCEVCNNFFPPQIRLTGSDTRIDEIMEHIKKALNRASQMGTKIIVFGSGPAKNIPADFPHEKAWIQIVDLLKNVDSLAATYGITIAIEPLRKAECNIVNTLSEGLKLAKEVNREHIKLLVDFYHMSIEKEDPEVIFEAGDVLKHVHFARSEGRIFPKDILEDNYMPFISNLKKSGYVGRISVEAYSKDFYRDAAMALAFLKKYFN